MNCTPNDIILGPIPLVGTLGKSEWECAAGLIIHTLKIFQRTWLDGVTADEIAIAAKNAIIYRREPIYSWYQNPFLRPDFDGLTQEEYATITPFSDTFLILLTEKFLKAIDRYITRDKRNLAN